MERYQKSSTRRHHPYTRSTDVKTGINSKNPNLDHSYAVSMEVDSEIYSKHPNLEMNEKANEKIGDFGQNDEKSIHFDQNKNEEEAQQLTSDIKNCSICLDSELSTDIFILPCLHKFHTRCIGLWFKRQLSCPICRLNLDDWFEPSIVLRNHRHSSDEFHEFDEGNDTESEYDSENDTEFSEAEETEYSADNESYVQTEDDLVSEYEDDQFEELWEQVDDENEEPELSNESYDYDTHGHCPNHGEFLANEYEESEINFDSLDENIY